jgi:hypothetical protein
VLTPATDGITASVSWNGSTEVGSWQFLAGADPSSLTPVKTVTRTGFETTAALSGTPAYVVARALDSKGRLLGASAVVASPKR